MPSNTFVNYRSGGWGMSEKDHKRIHWGAIVALVLAFLAALHHASTWKGQAEERMIAQAARSENNTLRIAEVSAELRAYVAQQSAATAALAEGIGRLDERMAGQSGQIVKIGRTLERLDNRQIQYQTEIRRSINGGAQ